jgi:hypothetical protein
LSSSPLLYAHSLPLFFWNRTTLAVIPQPANPLALRRLSYSPVIAGTAYLYLLLIYLEATFV